eukprot:363996-Chlamydomonas_euryale.AAC.4
MQYAGIAGQQLNLHIVHYCRAAAHHAICTSLLGGDLLQQRPASGAMQQQPLGGVMLQQHTAGWAMQQQQQQQQPLGGVMLQQHHC